MISSQLTKYIILILILTYKFNNIYLREKNYLQFKSFFLKKILL